MTIKSSRKKSGSRAAKATNRKNSKATAPKQPGITKLALLVAHLSAPGGATIAELCKATGWQPHSVRGGLAGALRRKGHVIRSEKEGGQRRYRIEEPVSMTGVAPLADEIEALMPLRLEGLREVWRNRYGAPPKLRSAALLRHCLAWRLQAEALGGLDRDTRRKLKRRQRVQAEGLELGIGTTLRREWRGRIVQVTVEEEGFRHGGQLFKSLSAAATAIAGTRWNGPRFFGLRSDK